MTNLTDEGLMEMAIEIVEHWYSADNAPTGLADRIASALKQVRDAAKKERDEKITTAFAEGERIGIERVRVLAWDLIKNDKLDTAIRQME